MTTFIKDWSQQHILLIGAQGGLGQALATQLTQLGAKLILVGRRQAELEQQAQQLGQRFFVCDLADPASVKQLRELAAVSSPMPNGVIYAAAINSTQFYTQAPWAEHAQTLEVNLVRPMQLTYALLPMLQRLPHSWMLQVGSVFGAIGFPTQTSYGASKAGLAAFCQALQREQGDAGCRIMYCAPRAIQTDFNRGVMATFNKRSKTNEDPPAKVAEIIVNQISQGKLRRTIGWPERFFVKLNGLAPRLVDSSMQKPRRLLRQLLKETDS